MDNIDFGNKIYEIRKKNNLSQKELGEMLGVSNKAVSKWENGEAIPKTATMLKLAEIFKVDVNDLLGFEEKQTDYTAKNNAEMERLNEENVLLSSKLAEYEKNRKRTLLISVAVCAVAVAFVILISLTIKTDKNINKSIKDAGSEGTKIVFLDKTFVVPDSFEKYAMEYIYGGSEYTDEKFATYFDKDGKEHKVLVQCCLYTENVILNVDNKRYFYINDKISNEILAVKNIDELWFAEETIVNNEKFGIDFYYNDDSGSKVIDCFVNYYKNKGKPVDKSITKSFLGNNPRRATVYINIPDSNISFSELALGEFFMDNDKNVYFYDYVTACSYFVEKELSDYVYKN